MGFLAQVEQISGRTRRERSHLRAVSEDFSAQESSELQHSTEVANLRARIAQLQGTSLGSRSIPTYPGLGKLLPGGGLRRGSSYAVKNSLTLALSMMAGPARTGNWCAVVGVPELNPEAAAEYGISLDRLVLIPEPGNQWLAVTSALTDVMGAVLLGSKGSISPGQSDRLASRLRERGTVLIALRPWDSAEAVLQVLNHQWSGLANGHGQLSQSSINVSAHWRQGTHRRGKLSLPGPTTSAQWTVEEGLPGVENQLPLGDPSIQKERNSTPGGHHPLQPASTGVELSSLVAGL